MGNDGNIGSLLGRVLRLHHQVMQKLLDDLGLHRGQPPIMFRLWHEDGLSQKQLTESLHLSPATITVMLRKMEKAGLVSRERDATDMRISRVYLTDYGRRLHSDAEAAFERAEEICRRGMSPADEDNLNRLLMHMMNNLSLEISNRADDTDIDDSTNTKPHPDSSIGGEV